MSEVWSQICRLKFASSDLIHVLIMLPRVVGKPWSRPHISLASEPLLWALVTKNLQG
jgi:hypothetical protein